MIIRMRTNDCLTFAAALTLALQFRTVAAQHFLDLNSLAAFQPALSPEQLALLSPPHTATTNATFDQLRGDIPTTPLPTSRSPQQQPPHHSLQTSPTSPSHRPEFQNPQSHLPSTSISTSASTAPYNPHNPPSTPPTNANDLYALLQRRQNACGTYTPCTALNAPSLCCAPNAICSQDSSGQVGCCPAGAACTGLIPAGAGVTPSTSTVVSSSGGLVVTTTTSPAIVTTTTAGAQSTVTAGGGGFVLAGSETVAVLGSGNGAGGRAGVLLGGERWLWVWGVFGSLVVGVLGVVL